MNNVYSPIDREKIGEIKEATKEEIKKAYELSKETFRTWSKTDIDIKIQYLHSIKKQLINKRDKIAKTIHLSTGKVLTDALFTEVLALIEAIGHIEKTAKNSLETKKVKTPIVFYNKESYIEYKPRGVVLIISPWNFPFQLSMMPMLEAIVGGNTVIIKPSEITPLIGILIEEIISEAGLPKGVVQVVHGGKEIGAWCVEEKPDFIHFTGSVTTGKKIQIEAAKKLIPTILELGGKDPFIVFEDSNIERAVKGCIWGAFTNAGQVCMSTERVYVQKGIFDTFVGSLIDETKNLKVGKDINDDIGSLTFPMQKGIIKKHVLEAIEKGAVLETGTHPNEWDEDSMYVEPMILTNVSENMLIMKEETFGPVLPIVPFETEEEVIKYANSTEFGLNASVWTESEERAKRVVYQLHTGNACINNVITSIGNPNLPYGGVKESGIGQYHGEVGIRNFCIQTSVMYDKSKSKTEFNWFPYRGKYKHFSDLIKNFYGENKKLGKTLLTFIKLTKK